NSPAEKNTAITGRARKVQHRSNGGLLVAILYMMRAAEWIHLVVFSFFAGLAWVRRLPGKRRRKVTLLGAIGLGATLTGAWLLPLWLPPLAVSVVRDWLPAALILLVYWQAGEFFQREDP